MRIRIVLFTILISAIASLDLSKEHYRELEKKFEEIMANRQHHRFRSSSSEKNFRRAIFFENASMVENYNANHDKTKLELNEFSVMTSGERKAHLGYKSAKKDLDKDENKGTLHKMVKKTAPA